MEGARWIADNWVTMLNAVGVVGGLFGLFFTAAAVRDDTKTRRISNLLTVTTNHREIWKEFLRRPELARVLDAAADIHKRPVSPDEAEFVNLVILHLVSYYYAMMDDSVVKLEGVRRDVGSFFALPVPRAAWQESKTYQNEDFVRFVESCMAAR